MLALSLRDSSLFRREVSACWCALLLGRKVLSILRGYPLALGRYRHGVLHGDPGVGAEFLDLFQGTIASVGVVVCLSMLQELQQALLTYQPCRPGCARNTSYEHTPFLVLWVMGERKRSTVLLSNCRRGVPVSRIVLTSDCIALMEERTLRPSPGTNMAEMQTGARWPAWSMMYPQMVPVVVADISCVRGSQWYSAPLASCHLSCFSAVLESAHLVYQVVRYVAVHKLFSFLKSLMLLGSLGISSSSSIKWSNAPLSTIIVNLSLLR